MQFTNICQLAFLAGLQVIAASAAKREALASNPANELFRRAMPALVSCGPWSLQSVEDAYNALITNGAFPNPQKPVAGTRYYPRLYGNKKGTPSDLPVVTALDAIPECKTGQAGQKFFEFPLTMPVFTGGKERSQGKDRVIAISPSLGQGISRTFTFCLAITHRGGTGPSDPSFRYCTSL